MLFGAKATGGEGEEPPFLLSPPPQWAVGPPDHQLQPGCGLSTADAQMPVSEAPVSAPPPGLAVCSSLAALGGDPLKMVEAAQMRKVCGAGGMA